jgi:Flp pilus assembly protein TadB
MGFIRKKPARTNIKEREAKIKELISREYRLYKEEELKGSLPKTLYEKACRASEKVLQIKPDEKNGKKIEEAIKFSHLKITPVGVSSFMIVFALITSLPTLLLITLGIFGLPGIPVGYGMIVLLIAMFFTYYLYTYPFHLKKRYEIEAGSEIVTMILYMAMYMRNTPNMEGALRFASENLSGPLGLELKKIMWDIEVGNYINVQDAFMDYTQKWAKNREFVEAIELLITSMKQVGDRRLTLLDEAVSVMLAGSREQARHFNQKLKMPVMIVHALGIILPVMGLVMFPIVAIFLKVESMVLFVGYDILLPMVLYFVISNILEIRPATFSRIDITDHPDVPPKGMFRMGKKTVKAWPFGLVTGAVIIALGIVLSFGDKEGILSSITILFGASAGLGIYYILLSSQRMKVRDKTRKIESEFAEALFQLGNQVSGGTPIELSIEHSMERIKNLEIQNLFSRALNNMKTLGFTFYQAFFDKEYGAIRYYPSKMIKSIMRTIVESTKKGVSTAAVAMLSISRYLKGLHDTQEDVKEELNDVLSSLKFQIYFLTPMISGIVGTLAIIIMRILSNLSKQAASISSGPLPFISAFGQANITPFEFIFIVGIYLIETCFILASFINSIESGEDPIGKYNITGYALLMGFVVFGACLFATLAFFGPLISSVLV